MCCVLCVVVCEREWERECCVACEERVGGTSERERERERETEQSAWSLSSFLCCRIRRSSDDVVLHRLTGRQEGKNRAWFSAFTQTDAHSKSASPTG